MKNSATHTASFSLRASTGLIMLAIATSSLIACGQYTANKHVSTNHDQERVLALKKQVETDAIILKQQMAVMSKMESLQQTHPVPARLSMHALESNDINVNPQVTNNRENYQKFKNGAVTAVSEQPVSTFSIDVDSASYANMRRYINAGQLPPKSAIRLEELINYFSYDYSNQNLTAEQPIAINSLLTNSPWNSNNQLIRIGINAYQVAVDDRPAANIVFLVDVSGSMQSANKLPLLKQSMLLMIKQLKADDSVAIVTYASGTNVALAATKVSHQGQIESAINNLSAAGSTHGSAGIELAYQQAQQGFIKEGINHIYLMSDGDMNVGIRDIDELKHRISQKRKAGVQFSSIGFGQGNYNDHLMEQLADTGNGIAAYIDSLHEAQKLLVDQLASNLQSVAYDVKIQVEFNPDRVSEYRLLGYENRQLNRADFKNDKKDAGDMGAGHSVTAIYEITLVDKPGLIEPFVFQGNQKANNLDNNMDLAEVRVRYKKQFNSTSSQQIQRINPRDQVNFDNINLDDQFAIAVAAFAQKLRGNEHLDSITYNDMIDWANRAKGSDHFGYRAEFVKLIRLTNTLSQQ